MHTLWKPRIDRVVSCNQMAAITSQWWRRLVNAYEVKACIVCFQCKNCVINTWELQRRASYLGHCTNLSAFTFDLTFIVNDCQSVSTVIYNTIHYKKLVPYMTAVASERRRHLANVIAIAKTFANWTMTLPSSKSRDTKTRTDIKNLLCTKVRYCSAVSESVVICQLILKMAEEIDFEKEFLTLKVSWPWPRIGSYGIPSCITHRPLPAYQISLESEILLWTDGHTDGYLSLTHVIRSTLWSQPNKAICSARH